MVVVDFPRAASTLRFAADTDALVPVDLSAGRPVRITGTRVETTIADVRDDGTFALASGEFVSAHKLWPLDLEGALIERLPVGDLDDVDDFITRINILHPLARSAT